MTRLHLSAFGTLILALGAGAACTAGPSSSDESGDGDSNGDGDSINLGDGDGDSVGDGDDDIVVGPSSGGTVGDGDMEPMEDCDSTLELTVRDFHSAHVDFEGWNGQDPIACGLVKPDLFIGTDGARTPEFNAAEGTGKRYIDANGIITCDPWNYMYNMNVPPSEGTALSTADAFAQWFSSDDLINSMFSYTLNLTLDPATGSYYFDSDESGGFWPADGQGFNEVTQGHNFHFTTEAHVRFGYMGGEKFTFSGDDDMWIFVNGKLALDLGGTHGELTATIDFDALAASLGIEKGRVYNMDIFHAERHTSSSNYRVETNIACFETVEVPTVVVR